MGIEHARAAAVVALGVFAVLGAIGTQAQPAPDYGALLAAPDRSDADRQADKRRDPAPFLAFAGLHPGMKTARPDVHRSADPRCREQPLSQIEWPLLAPNGRQVSSVMSPISSAKRT